MDKVSRSILGYQVSTSMDVGPSVLTMHMVFDKFKEFPGKWQLLIYLGQQTILEQQKAKATGCS